MAFNDTHGTGKKFSACLGRTRTPISIGRSCVGRTVGRLVGRHSLGYLGSRSSQSVVESVLVVVVVVAVVVAVVVVVVMAVGIEGKSRNGSSAVARGPVPRSEQIYATHMRQSV